MPIISITIQNFKGIRGPLRVELKPITLLFGPNSSGKSTIVQALHFAREIFERENVNPDRTVLGADTINLGGFENLVHKHDKTLPIILRFDLDLGGEALPDYFVSDGYEEPGSDFWSERIALFIPTEVRTAWVEIQLQWSELLNRPIVKRYSVGTNGEDLADITASDDGQQVNITKLIPYNPVFLKEATVEAAKINGVKLLAGEEEITDKEKGELGEGFLRILELMDIVEGLPGLSEPYHVGPQQSAIPLWGRPLGIHGPRIASLEVDFEDEDSFVLALSSLIVGTGELVKNALKKLCYLGPLRIIPPRDFQPNKTPDESRWANGMAAWDILIKSDKTFIDRINQWLYGADRLNSGYKVIIKEYKEMDVADPIMVSLLKGSHSDEGENLTDRINSLPTHRRLLLWEGRNRIEVQPLDIGVGISQLLPVIVAVMSAKSGLVAIEQPELHAHPALQVTLGDLFISQAKEHPDVTFIIETHSEHLLLRIMRRMRETKEGKLPEGCMPVRPEDVMVLFFETDGQCSIVREMPLNERGELVKAWPGGFFEEGLREVL
jgi:hypothetical protein